MKSVIRELYYGNIRGKNIVLPEKTRKQELALYDKVKATLSAESEALFEKFLELVENNYDTLMRKIYKRGITTGMLLAIEAFEEGDKLCD